MADHDERLVVGLDAVKHIGKASGGIGGTQLLHKIRLSDFRLTSPDATVAAVPGADKDILYSLAILWPRRWEFTANPRDVIQVYIEAEEPAPIEELHRDLSLHMHNSYLENRKGLEQLSVYFQIASGLLTIDVVLWIIAIASTA